MNAQVSPTIARDDPSAVGGADKHQNREALTKSVQGLELSVRALRVLNELHIDTIGDLARLTPDALSGRRNCGRKTIAEILGFVERLRGNIAVRTCAVELNDALRDAASCSAREEFDRLPTHRILPLRRQVSELWLSTRTLNTLEALRVRYVGDLLQLRRSDLLQIQNFGRKSLNEIEHALSAMGLSMGTTHLDWDRDLAARLERKFEHELNEIRLRELDGRFLRYRGDGATKTEEHAAGMTEERFGSATQVTAGWRMKPKSGKALLLEERLHQFLRALTSRRNAEILHRLYGWDGLGPRTLGIGRPGVRNYP